MSIFVSINLTTHDSFRLTAVIKSSFHVSWLWGSPYLHSPDIRDRDGARSTVQVSPLINDCDQFGTSRFATLNLMESLWHLAKFRIYAIFAADSCVRLGSCGWLCMPYSSRFSLLEKGKFCAISSKLRDRNISRQRTPCVLCAHLALTQ